MKIVIIAVVLILLLGAVYLVAQNFSRNDLGVVPSLEFDYIDISVSELEQMLENKDFKLIDVHIPEQQHIPNTDKMIAYNNVDEFISQFPNKDEKIVLYCRSGGMSRALSQELIDKGYANIYNLAGGLNVWQANGKPTISIGSLE